MQCSVAVIYSERVTEQVINGGSVVLRRVRRGDGSTAFAAVPADGVRRDVLNWLETSAACGPLRSSVDISVKMVTRTFVAAADQSASFHTYPERTRCIFSVRDPRPNRPSKPALYV